MPRYPHIGGFVHSLTLLFAKSFANWGVNQAKRNIAILFFSQTAEAEAKRKVWSLHGGARKNAAIADALIHKTLHTLKETGLPVIHFHEGIQQGDSFGERFAHAFQVLFDAGYDAVISVGNDSPDLGRLDWTDIVHRVDGGEAVLGRTFAGGSYLIGLQRTQFRQAEFERLPWETNTIFNALCGFLADSTAAQLPVLADLNSAVDLQEWLQENVRVSVWARFLAALCEVQKMGPATDDGSQKSINQGASASRAPPAVY